MFSTPRKHFFKNFLGVPFAENHKTHINSNYPNYFFSPFFSLSIGWEVFLSWFLIKFAAQKKKRNGGNRVGLQTPHDFSFKNRQLFFFFSFFCFELLFFCVCVLLLQDKQKMWKFTQNLFDSVLFCTGEEESPMCFNYYSIFFGNFVWIKIYACLYLRVLVTWMCVYIKMNVKLIISVFVGVFFFTKKKMRLTDIRQR